MRWSIHHTFLLGLLPLLAAFGLLQASHAAQSTDPILSKADHMQTLVKNCLATNVYGDRPDAPLICACGAGYMAAALPSRQYAMVALLSEAGLDVDKMGLIMSTMVKDGIATKKEVQEAASMMVVAGQQADIVCIASDPKTAAGFLHR